MNKTVQAGINPKGANAVKMSPLKFIQKRYMLIKSKSKYRKSERWH